MANISPTLYTNGFFGPVLKSPTQMGLLSITLYTNGFFGSVLKSPTQMGLLSVNNSVTNISRLGTFKKALVD
jgi:hypothetical protein